MGEKSGAPVSSLAKSSSLKDQSEALLKESNTQDQSRQRKQQLQQKNQRSQQKQQNQQKQQTKQSNGSQKSQSKDYFCRINYLHQVSALSQRKNSMLARMSNKTLLSVAKKTTARLSPSLKTKICKNCDSFLIPGVSCTITVGDILIVTCTNCETVRSRIPMKKYKETYWNSSETTKLG